MFRTPALTPADQVVLAGVEALRDRLRHQVQVHPGRLTSGLRRFLTADAVAASNSIEGFHVTTQDVQDLMDGERDVEVSDENREETLAYQRMMTYVQSLHDAGDFAYSKGLLNALHWMLQTLLIAREGVLAPEFSSIEAWLGRPGNTWEYYQQLQRRGATYQPDGDVAGWIRFNLIAYHQQAQAVQHRLDQSAAVWELLAAYAGDAGLDERVLTALHDVAVGGRIRRARYEQSENLTLQPAQRDLRDLATAGLLVPVGRTRARYYTEGPRFPAAALERARTPFTLVSPYPND